jgi:hypothetical protein
VAQHHLKENVGGEEDIDASRGFMLQMNETRTLKHINTCQPKHVSVVCS